MWYIEEDSKWEELNEFKNWGTVVYKHGGIEGELRERGSCGRQVYHRITRKDHERKECIHRNKGRVKEQYFPANTDIWIRDLYGLAHHITY